MTASLCPDDERLQAIRALLNRRPLPQHGAERVADGRKRAAAMFIGVLKSELRPRYGDVRRLEAGVRRMLLALSQPTKPTAVASIREAIDWMPTSLDKYVVVPPSQEPTIADAHRLAGALIVSCAVLPCPTLRNTVLTGAADTIARMLDEDPWLSFHFNLAPYHKLCVEHVCPDVAVSRILFS